MLLHSSMHAAYMHSFIHSFYVICLWITCSKLGWITPSNGLSTIQWLTSIHQNLYAVSKGIKSIVHPLDNQSWVVQFSFVFFTWSHVPEQIKYKPAFLQIYPLPALPHCFLSMYLVLRARGNPLFQSKWKIQILKRTKFHLHWSDSEPLT